VIVAVVPALNEQDSVGDVVRGAAEHADVVVVVDDGSSDETAERARLAGATVVSHTVNRGVGAAIATGLVTARELGATIVVQVDGDGQHDTGFIPRVVECVRAGADLAVGTRFETGFDMGRARRMLLGLFARLISARIGVRVSDPTSGFRGFGTRAIAELAPVFPTKYLSDTVEVLFIAHERQLVVDTVPVRMRQRPTGSSSVGPLTGIVYTLRILGIIAAHSLRLR
jgi:glycosyltransferase involved in cell wall biosynthesis